MEANPCVGGWYNNHQKVTKGNREKEYGYQTFLILFLLSDIYRERNLVFSLQHFLKVAKEKAKKKRAKTSLGKGVEEEAKRDADKFPK